MQLSHAAVFLFWIFSGLLFYTFLGYGLLISALARGRSLIPPPGDAPRPSVCVVRVAHNEERDISERLRNLLAAQYPAEMLRVLLVSDGSTDGTAAQARALQEARVEIVERPERAGKAAGLNL